MKSAVAAAAFCLVASVPGHAQSWAYDDGSVPFVVTPGEVVERMLRIADVGPGDYVIDLGSGDGRIVIGAAKRGARSLGIDIDPALVRTGRENAASAGVADRVEFSAQDLFEADLRNASVITLYLLPDVNIRLRPKLLALKPGTRVVSHDWGMGAWQPDELIELRTPEKPVGNGVSRVHLWMVPADARGSWTGEVPGHGPRWEFSMRQEYQVLNVTARAAGRDMVVRGMRLRGEEIKLVVSGLVGAKPWNHRFTGTIAGDRINGEVLVSDGEQQRTLPWTASRNR